MDLEVPACRRSAAFGNNGIDASLGPSGKGFKPKKLFDSKRNGVLCGHRTQPGDLPAESERSAMGFSASLQGDSSHVALISRQDAELRFLDTIKRVLIARAKCDRDYGAALNQLAQTAAKMDVQDEALGDSLLHKAWLVMIKGLEEWSDIMKQNSDTLVVETVEKFSALITEKRASRKVYYEEHLRVSNEVTRLQEAVVKVKANYEVALENYKNSKGKYEEHFLKGKPGRKLHELKERYQRASRKLHHMHNEYVLLLSEAVDYERDFRAVLLPGLLEYQQTVQEDMILKWKSIMHEVCDLTDMSRGRYAQLQTEISDALKAVTSTTEYATFTEKNRSLPPEPVPFEFAKDLLGNSGVGSLQSNQLAVDSLTMDALRSRLITVEQRMKEVSSELRDKQSLLNQHETEITNIKKNSVQDHNIACRLPVLKRASDVLRRELNELRCRESWLQHEHRLIHDPLAAAGCDDLSSTPPTTNHVNGDTGFRSGSLLSLNFLSRHEGQSLKSRSSVIRDMLKKPFHRTKANGNSPASTPPTPTRAATEERDDGGQNNDSLSLNNVSVDQTHEDVQLPQEQNYDPDRSLEDEAWFHGVLPREEVVRLLVNDGDYLVRETTRNEERQIVLSVFWGTHKHFIVQTTAEGYCRFEGPAFPTIQQLILHQHSCGLPVTNKSGCILRTPIFRERWELNNDDVELLDKIGRGNFGDVHKARLVGSGLEVAVKTCRVTLPDEQKKFVQECRILKQYDHPNIVKFIGICVQKQPIMIVMELVPGGSLLNFVRNQKGKLSVKQLTGMCLDTTAGMAYLESKNCIHRDLAARNCLVGHRNIVKISDFGMSREEEEYIVSDGMKQIPIKWTAPEALNFGKYTSLCDVWSYAVLCWEIFSFGDVPYQGCSNTKAREMIDSGYRMMAPSDTPDEMYQLMLRCWEYEPEKRPHFSEIYATVKVIYDKQA